MYAVVVTFKGRGRGTVYGTFLATAVIVPPIAVMGVLAVVAPARVGGCRSVVVVAVAAVAMMGR